MLRKICLIFGLFYLVYSPLYAQDAGCPLKLDLKIIEPTFRGICSRCIREIGINHKKM